MRSRLPVAKFLKDRHYRLLGRLADGLLYSSPWGFHE